MKNRHFHLLCSAAGTWLAYFLSLACIYTVYICMRMQAFLARTLAEER